MIKTLIFDLDNTLFEYDVAFEDFIKNLGRRFNVRFDDEMALIHQKNEKGYAPRVAFFDWLAEHYSLETNGEALWAVMQADFSKFILVTKSTKKMLKQLSAEYTVAILTNGSSLSQRKKIERSGLDKSVPHIFISEELGHEKPSPEIFRTVCEQLDTSPEHTLYIGDHWENDIEGGKNAGLKTCWLSRTDALDPDAMASPIKPTHDADLCDYVIRSLDELPSMLAFGA